MDKTTGNIHLDGMIGLLTNLSPKLHKGDLVSGVFLLHDLEKPEFAELYSPQANSGRIERHLRIGNYHKPSDDLNVRFVKPLIDGRAVYQINPEAIKSLIPEHTHFHLGLHKPAQTYTKGD